MEIDETLRKAMRDASDALGSQRLFAKQVRIQPSMLSRYLHTETKWVTDKVWRRIIPCVKQYLPPEYLTTVGGTATARVSERALNLAKIYDRLKPHAQQQLYSFAADLLVNGGEAGHVP